MSHVGSKTYCTDPPTKLNVDAKVVSVYDGDTCEWAGCSKAVQLNPGLTQNFKSNFLTVCP